jgi:hypothetical protein
MPSNSHLPNVPHVEASGFAGFVPSLKATFKACQNTPSQ